MGDRRTAEIRMFDGSLYVYTHWHGHKFHEMAKDAIKVAEPRWNDHMYAARIIVDQLTRDARDLETGFGLMLVPNAEDEYGANPSIIIDLVNRELLVFDENVHPWATSPEKWKSESFLFLREAPLV